MPKFKSEDLLNELAEDVKKIIGVGEYFKEADKTKMIYCPDKGKWSVVQVLEHLNAYNRFYLPEIEKQLSLITYKNNPWFNSGFLGNYFTNSMKPKNVLEIRNKMKTSKSYTFPNSLNVETVLNEFLGHQHKLLQLMEQAKKRDLNAIKLPITITSLIKLKLGDIFRFLIAHEQRHMIQARNTLRAVGVSTDKFPVILQVSPQ
jgi:hypothetical protein